MHRVLFIALCLLLAACGAGALPTTAPKVDTSTEETAKASMQKVRDSLPEAQREEFTKAAETLMMSQIDIQGMMAGALAGATAVPAADQVAKLTSILNGKTGAEIIAEAKTVREKAQATGTAIAAAKSSAPKATDAPKAAPTTALAPKATDVPKPAPTTPPTAAPKAAPTQPPTAAPAAVGKVGEPIEVNGVRLTVHKAEKKSELSQFQKAKDARTYVVVEVTVENTGDKAHTANTFNLKLRDADGQQYSATFGTQDALQLANLAKGDKARGTVPFDVKADAKGLMLLYDTQPLPSTAQTIRVDLGLQ